MNLISTTLAMTEDLPPLSAMYDYVVTGNGLFIRAEDSRMATMVQVAEASLPGLSSVEPYARLKTPKLSASYLRSILISARKHMPNEVLYQFLFEDDKWRVVRPKQVVNSVAVVSIDESAAVVDLHSHNSMAAFFSDTDDADEQGLRFYCVIGKLDTDRPEIACRAGVYGYHMAVRVEDIFTGSGPFVDTFDAEWYQATLQEELQVGQLADDELLDGFAEALGVTTEEINPNALLDYLKELGKRSRAN